MPRRFLYLNGLAILAVVLYHAASWGFVAMFWWSHRYTSVASPDFGLMFSPTYFGLRSIEQLIAFAIPAFLFVSGFFASFATGGDDTKMQWKYFLVRIRNLSVPYLIWSVVILLLEALNGQIRPPGEYIRVIFLGQATPAFYFVPLLSQLYLLSPLLTRWVKRNWKALLLLAAAMQISIQAIEYLSILVPRVSEHVLVRILTAGWFLGGNIFPFVFGLFVGLNQKTTLQWLKRYRWTFLVAFVGLFVLGIVEWEVLLRASGETWIGPEETLLDNIYALVVILCFMSFQTIRYPLANQVFNLGEKSYGVYLIHSIVLTYASKIAYHFVPWLLGKQILFQPMLIVLGIGVPLLMMAVVNRSPLKPFYSSLFG